LGKEAIPKVHGEGFVGAAKSGYEVVFEGLNCSFSGIAAMDMGWH
jgi:hypothetical protein